MTHQINYLDRNEFNFQPAPAVIEAFRAYDPTELGFYTRIYDEGKKSKFSVYLSTVYHVDESQILLGYGGEYILKQVVHYYLTRPERNNTMFIPKFSWWYYQSVADEVGGRTVQYPLYEDGDTYSYNLATLIDMLHTELPSLLLLASPNNPTGNCLTPEQLEALLPQVPKETIVYIDEAYASYVNEDSSYVSRLVEKFSNLVVCRTMSKFYGLPGLRMGFAFVSKGMEDFAKFNNLYLGYNRISEELAIAALKSEDYYRNVARAMNCDRAMYEQEIGRLEGFKVYRSAANFILVKYPIALKEALQQAFKDEDYKVKFMNEPDINTHMRITLGRPEQNKTVCQTIVNVATQH